MDTTKYIERVLHKKMIAPAFVPVGTTLLLGLGDSAYENSLELVVEKVILDVGEGTPFDCEVHLERWDVMEWTWHEVDSIVECLSKDGWEEQ